MENIDYFFVESAHDGFNLQTKILEIGSRVQENQAHLGIRQIFASKNDKREYVGVDYINGEGVDLISNVQNLPFPDNYFKTIVAMNLFEHVEQFWHAFDETIKIAFNGWNHRMLHAIYFRDSWLPL